MEKFNGSLAEGEREPLGLEFELGDNMGEQLVFDAPELVADGAPMVEIDLSGAERAPSKIELSVPDTYISDAKYISESFIDDPMQLSPTYVPRFTEASERYRTAYKASERESDEKRAAGISDLDPTAEVDEGREAPHVLVQGRSAPIDVSDESIRILKFDEERELDTVSAEERELEALKNVVAESAYPKDADSAAEGDAATDGEESIEELLDEAVEAKAQNMPDPFLELTLVDYTPSDNDPESLSAEEAPLESAAGGDNGEFVRPSQRDATKDGFLDHIVSVKIRLIGAAVLLAVLVLFDVLSLFSINIFSIFGVGSVSYAAAAVDLQFAVCLAMFASPEIYRALRNLSRRVVSPELVIILSLIMVAVNSLTVIATNAVSYPTFAVLLGIQVIASIAASYHRLSADFSAFKIISKNTVKNILDKRMTRSLPRENLALDGVVDEYDSKIGRLFRAAFISDFFARTGRAVENTANNLLMLLSSLGVAVVTALITWLVGGSGLAGFTGTLAFVFMLSFPAFSILVHKLPYHRSVGATEAEHGAFVGESSLYACSDIDVIAYDDTEIFGLEDVSIKKVHLYGKAYNAGKAMQQMYAVFSAIGGPLRDIFAASVDGGCEAVIDVNIEDDGVSGTLGGRSVAAGTLEYMQRNGIAVPEGDSGSSPLAGDSTKVMYGAEDGVVYVKFFIRYSFSEEFTMLLPSLKKAGIVPLIYTRDPNLTVEFFKMLTLGEDIIRVMKKHTLPSAEDKVYRRVSAGIVTLGDKQNAVNMVLLAKKYTVFQSALSTCELIAMLAGTVVAVMFAVTGSLALPMSAMGLLQLAWCGYLYFRSHRILKDKSVKEDDNVV